MFFKKLFSIRNFISECLAAILSNQFSLGDYSGSNWFYCSFHKHINYDKTYFSRIKNTS
jgi:hypothetical protein